MDPKISDTSFDIKRKISTFKLRKCKVQKLRKTRYLFRKLKHPKSDTVILELAKYHLMKIIS